MDLSHPEYAVLGENRARILYRLAVLAEPTSGRRIHHLSGVASLRTTQRILGELVDVGLVDVQAVGAANAYTLNRAHVLWSPIEQILAVPAATESKIAEIVSAAVRDHAVATAIYGSYARGKLGPSPTSISWSCGSLRCRRIKLPASSTRSANRSESSQETVHSCSR